MAVYLKKKMYRGSAAYLEYKFVFREYLKEETGSQIEKCIKYTIICFISMM